MKNILFFSIFIFLSLKSFSHYNSNDSSVNIKLFYILNKLDSVITNSSDKNEMVESHYKFVLEKIKNKQLTFRFDSTLTYNFHDCSGVAITADSSNAVLLLGNFIFDAYNKYPSLVFATLMHDYQHVFDFYKNKLSWINGYTNPIEKVLFEADAYAIEALFLQTYLKNKYTFSPFENYLINDLKYTKLIGISAIIDKTNIELLHNMNEIMTSDKPLKESLAEFQKLGQTLIDSTVFSTDTTDRNHLWANYCNLINLRTYVYYSRQALFNIVSKKDKNSIAQKEFKIEKYSEIYSTIIKIQDLIKSNYKYFNIGNGIVENWKRYYKVEKNSK